MSGKPTYQCPYCLRVGFKTEKGVRQHIKASERCKERDEARLSTNINEKKAAELARVRETIENEGRRATRSQLKARLVNDADQSFHSHEDPQQSVLARPPNGSEEEGITI